MPYASDAQRRFMHAKHPGIAKRWDKEYPNQKGLPEHVGDAKKEGAKEASMNLNEKVIEALQYSAAALNKAETERQEKQAADARYSEKIASVVNQCVKFNRIDDTADEREKLAQWLSTPEGALEVIEKLAEHEVEAPASASLGTPADSQGRPTVQTKKASYDSLNDPYVGRRSGQEPESWRRLTVGLGLA